MRVPAARSSAFWVQPWSMTTSGIASPTVPLEMYSLYARVPALFVNDPATNRPAVEGASGARTRAASRAGSRSITGDTPPASAPGRTIGAVLRAGGAKAPGEIPPPSARWMRAVASSSRPARVSRVASAIPSCIPAPRASVPLVVSGMRNPLFFVVGSLTCDAAERQLPDTVRQRPLHGRARPESAEHDYGLDSL